MVCSDTVCSRWKTCRLRVLGDLLVAVAAQVDAAAPPELVPGQDVALQQLVEPVGQPLHPPAGRVARLGDGPVLGGVQRHQLLDGDRLALAHVDGEVLGDEAGLLHGPPLDGDSSGRPGPPGCGPPGRSAPGRSWSPPAAIRVSSPLSPASTGTRWRPSSACSAPRRRWSPGRPGPSGPPGVPTSSRGPTVVSRPARCGSAMETKRRWVTLVTRPSGSRTRSRRVSTPRRRSSSCR